MGCSNIRNIPAPRRSKAAHSGVLNQGNHKEITKWRLAQAQSLTRLRRPDLWALYEKPKG